MVDTGKVFRRYGPQDHEGFLRSLEDLAFQDPNWLFVRADDPKPWQGDVVPELEVAYTNQAGGTEQYVGPAMLLSNGCDMVPGQDPLTAAAPVFNLDEYMDWRDAEDPDSILGNLRRNRLTEVFYLPEFGDHPEQCVSFTLAGAISTHRVTGLYDDEETMDDVLRLSDSGWYLLTGKLAHHYVRSEDREDFPRV